MTAPIRTLEEHAAALRRIDELMAGDPAPGSVAYDELVRLAREAEAFEKVRFPCTECTECTESSRD